MLNHQDKNPYQTPNPSKIQNKNRKFSISQNQYNKNHQTKQNNNF